ncbi:MAG: hypothetical protein JKX81_08910 [Arenicella sp.]|nr:hypothetical protein [Arenicella sp.]
MANVQKQFDKFHSNIRLSNDDEKSKLQDKRDLLVKNLKDGLKKRAEEGKSSHSFDSFNQGSYAMHTGTKPLNDEYDIDVGIIFDNFKGDFDSPVELKKIVKKAIESNFRTVNIRRPCVTVTYQKDGKPEYHVDLAVYVKKQYSDSYYLAMGKEHSSEENLEWLDSDPKGLITTINNRFTGDDRKQFKRSIRFFKRWRDKKFTNSNEAPISIALTCAAYHWFTPSKPAGEYSDLRAILDLANTMLGEFSLFSNRLTVTLPVIPNNNLLEGVTDNQMDVFKEKLTGLRDALQDALDEDSIEEACKILGKQFGEEFPEGEDVKDGAESSLKSKIAPVVTVGSSA